MQETHRSKSLSGPNKTSLFGPLDANKPKATQTVDEVVHPNSKDSHPNWGPAWILSICRVLGSNRQTKHFDPNQAVFRGPQTGATVPLRPQQVPTKRKEPPQTWEVQETIRPGAGRHHPTPCPAQSPAPQQTNGPFGGSNERSTQSHSKATLSSDRSDQKCDAGLESLGLGSIFSRGFS